jgi:cell wall-associated NlpC family hydrolase
MTSRRQFRLRRHLRMLAVCLVCLVSIPGEVFASLDITPGQSATVSDTGGDPINLRAKPRTDSAVLGAVSEGDLVDVIEGPMQDASGLWWYKVVANGTRAYIAADFLSVSGGSSGSNPVGVVTGTATITNTGDDPINCRSGAGSEYSVIGAFTEGDRVELTGERVGPWQPVNCAGQGGYVHTDFLSYGGSSDGGDNSTTATRATIVNTGGDPINCRARATTGSTVLTVFYEGDPVTLTGPLVRSWQPVTCAGTDGFVHKDYLSKTIAGGGGDTGGSVTGTGVIAYTNGDGLNCRAEASFSGAVITVLTEGTKVDLRGAAASGWQPIVCAGQNGYVSADYIDISDNPPTPTPPAPTTDLQPGDDAVVANTNGDGVRLRSDASSSSSIITVLAEGAAVTVRTGSTGDWVAVTYRTSNGFVHKDYLAKAKAADPTPTPDPGSGSGLRANDHAELTDDMNFRTEASFSGAIQTVLPKGTVVLITGAATSSFYPASVGGFSGYLHGDYLVKTDKPITDNGDSVGGNPGTGAATPQGQKVIDYAMRFLGYPYVWATHGPDTFDCSGFTYYVTIKTLKQDIGAGTWSQSISGRPVAFGDLRPGDLVFFQNTYTWGLSHVGIYIGDGKFIHAENEQTGVVISSLTSTYYKTRWYGARRITTD